MNARDLHDTEAPFLAHKDGERTAPEVISVERNETSSGLEQLLETVRSTLSGSGTLVDPAMRIGDDAGDEEQLASPDKNKNILGAIKPSWFFAFLKNHKLNIPMHGSWPYINSAILLFVLLTFALWGALLFLASILFSMYLLIPPIKLPCCGWILMSGRLKQAYRDDSAKQKGDVQKLLWYTAFLGLLGSLLCSCTLTQIRIFFRTGAQNRDLKSAYSVTWVSVIYTQFEYCACAVLLSLSLCFDESKQALDQKVKQHQNRCAAHAVTGCRDAAGNWCPNAAILLQALEQRALQQCSSTRLLLKWVLPVLLGGVQAALPFFVFKACPPIGVCAGGSAHHDHEPAVQLSALDEGLTQANLLVPHIVWVSFFIFFLADPVISYSMMRKKFELFDSFTDLSKSAKNKMPYFSLTTSENIIAYSRIRRYLISYLERDIQLSSNIVMSVSALVTFTIVTSEFLRIVLTGRISYDTNTWFPAVDFVVLSFYILWMLSNASHIHFMQDEHIRSVQKQIWHNRVVLQMEEPSRLWRKNLEVARNYRKDGGVTDDRTLCYVQKLALCEFCDQISLPEIRRKAQGGDCEGRDGGAGAGEESGSGFGAGGGGGGGGEIGAGSGAGAAGIVPAAQQILGGDQPEQQAPQFRISDVISGNIDYHFHLQKPLNADLIEPRLGRGGGSREGARGGVKGGAGGLLGGAGEGVEEGAGAGAIAQGDSKRDGASGSTPAEQAEVQDSGHQHRAMPCCRAPSPRILAHLFVSKSELWQLRSSGQRPAQMFMCPYCSSATFSKPVWWIDKHSTRSHPSFDIRTGILRMESNRDGLSSVESDTRSLDSQADGNELPTTSPPANIPHSLAISIERPALSAGWSSISAPPGSISGGSAGGVAFGGAMVNGGGGCHPGRSTRAQSTEGRMALASHHEEPPGAEVCSVLHTSYTAHHTPYATYAAHHAPHTINYTSRTMHHMHAPYTTHTIHNIHQRHYLYATHHAPHTHIYTHTHTHHRTHASHKYAAFLLVRAASSRYSSCMLLCPPAPQAQRTRGVSRKQLVSVDPYHLFSEKPATRSLAGHEGRRNSRCKGRYHPHYAMECINSNQIKRHRIRFEPESWEQLQRLAQLSGSNQVSLASSFFLPSSSFFSFFSFFLALCMISPTW
jgi:hypothetical protein